MTKLLAYHGDHDIKSEVIADMKADIEAERLIAGKYWSGENGCHIGCVLHARSVRSGTPLEHGDHSLYENLIGVPSDLAHLFDGLFESLPDGDRQKFSLDILEAITPGADLSDVARQWLIWLLSDARQYATEDTAALSAIDGAILLLQERCQDKEDWHAASAAARAAARATQANKILDLLRAADE